LIIKGKLELFVTIYAIFLHQNADGLNKPRYFNYLAQILFVAIVLTFNIVFWSYAVSHYLADPESFLELPLF
jgi:hypothetical protein